MPQQIQRKHAPSAGSGLPRAVSCKAILFAVCCGCSVTGIGLSSRILCTISTPKRVFPAPGQSTTTTKVCCFVIARPLLAQLARNSSSTRVNASSRSSSGWSGDGALEPRDFTVFTEFQKSLKLIASPTPATFFSPGINTAMRPTSSAMGSTGEIVQGDGRLTQPHIPAAACPAARSSRQENDGTAHRAPVAAADSVCCCCDDDDRGDTLSGMSMSSSSWSSSSCRRHGGIEVVGAVEAGVTVVVVVVVVVVAAADKVVVDGEGVLVSSSSLLLLRSPPPPSVLMKMKPMRRRRRCRGDVMRSQYAPHSKRAPAKRAQAKKHTHTSYVSIPLHMYAPSAGQRRQQQYVRLHIMPQPRRDTYL